ncbi:MAG: bifunctional oligoribonuclease/PAP phosphatase NrnA [Ruminococcaceae bacterium]|nr:bifunctional oligoribonuclease/PAP phosphatase NrnA [Oscillospiraceae bacterium]
MSRMIDTAATAAMLANAQDVVILIHQYPDGDTIGSGYALYYALRAVGKRARVECCDEIPEKYEYLLDSARAEAFEPQFVVAVDVADDKLLGSLKDVYNGRIDLCIDHHGSNTEYADYLLLKADYAAAAMVMCEVLREMNATLTSTIAECIYTGISTDTGCFKYSNADAYTHRMAADMMEIGIRYDMINRSMFDVKSRARVELERMALSGMRFYRNGKIAVMPITCEMIRESGAAENDMEGLAPMPRQIEGVWVGVTMREKPGGEFKISVRTGNHADASAICKQLDGGGHIRAAGCSLMMSLDDAIQTMVDTIVNTVDRI